MWLSTFTSSSEPLSRLLRGTFKEAELILMHPEIDRTTEHISYNLTQQPFPSCVLGTAGKLLWFTSGMATCRVSTVSRLVFSVRSFFASWDPLLLLRDPTQVSQQLGFFPELWLQYFLRELAARTSYSVSFLLSLTLQTHCLLESESSGIHDASAIHIISGDMLVNM